MPRFARSASTAVCLGVLVLSGAAARADLVIDSPQPPPQPTSTPTEHFPNTRGSWPRLIDIRPVFFPPDAPVYGDPVKPFSNLKAFNGRKFLAPIELADDAGELFYPELGSRISEKKLDDGLSQRLATYRSTRQALLNELHNALTAARTASDPGTREDQLREFAAKQTPQIVALETEAEQLREKLMRSFRYNADWNDNREWKLDALSGVPPPVVAAAEYQVLRAAAFYQAGLSVEQRGLLREEATLLFEEHRAHLLKGRDPNLTAIFFSPEGARFRPSLSLLRKLGPQIAALTQLKNALRRELREAVNSLDSLSDSKRTKALQKLAESQWPQMVEAENLANEIRRAVAAAGPPSLPAAPPRLPSALAAKIDAYRREREELQLASIENLRDIVLIPPPRIENPGDARDAAQRFREARAKNAAQRQKAIDKFNEEYGERLKASDQTLAEIRTDLEALAQTETDPKTGKPMTGGELFRRLNLADARFAAIGREEAMYPDYRTAMLEPGLSPEQRRLLFASAVTALAQPLPFGDRMPAGPTPDVSF